MSPTSRPVSKAAAKRVTRKQSKSILISDKMHEQEDADSEESIESNSLKECNSRDHYNNRQQNKAAQNWNAKFQELQLYKAKHGHCNAPRSAGKLGTWVDHQRRQYRQLQEGKRSNMTDERFGKLESIGFQWSLRGSNYDAWESMFDELKSYKVKHGHCNVPTQSTGKLGRWVSNQRQLYKLLQEGKQSSMTDERIGKLESIGFQWSPRGTNEDAWNNKFEKLKSYKVKHGHCSVPQRAGKLGRWVDFQRQQYRLLQEGKQSSMTDERIQKLESIGFQWSVVRAAVLVGGATEVETVSTSTPDDTHHGVTGASFHDHITNVDCELNDSRDISCDEPDVVISSEAASNSEFRPFLLGGGYC